MAIREIQTDDYKIDYDEDNASITFQGSLRLSGMEEYAPIVEILEEIASQDPDTISLNLLGLEFLNSSGISMLSKFVIKIRQKKAIKMVVKGSKKNSLAGQITQEFAAFNACVNIRDGIIDRVMFGEIYI